MLELKDVDVLAEKEKPAIHQHVTTMNMSNQPEANQTELDLTNCKHDFISIDDPTLKWPPFVLSMLRIGRILTARESVRREITATQISRLMNKHRNELPDTYTAKEIRSYFEYYGCYFSGGGIVVEGYELSDDRSPRHYHFTFTRLALEQQEPSLNIEPKEELK